MAKEEEADEQGGQRRAVVAVRRPVERTVRRQVSRDNGWIIGGQEGSRVLAACCVSGLHPTASHHTTTRDTDDGQPSGALAPHQPPPPHAQGDGCVLGLDSGVVSCSVVCGVEMADALTVDVDRPAGGQPRARRLRLVALGEAARLGALPRGLAARPCHGGGGGGGGACVAGRMSQSVDRPHRENLMEDLACTATARPRTRGRGRHRSQEQQPQQPPCPCPSALLGLRCLRGVQAGQPPDGAAHGPPAPRLDARAPPALAACPRQPPPHGPRPALGSLLFPHWRQHAGFLPALGPLRPARRRLQLHARHGPHT